MKKYQSVATNTASEYNPMLLYNNLTSVRTKLVPPVEYYYTY